MATTGGRQIPIGIHLNPSRGCQILVEVCRSMHRRSAKLAIEVAGHVLFSPAIVHRRYFLYKSNVEKDF
jgi:hypothetical protein